MFRALATTALRGGFVRPKVLNPKLTFFRAFSQAGDKHLGTVKWFDSKKGFGFLVPDDGTEDVFVHHSVIHAEGFRNLMEGEPVEFDVVEDENGRKSATNVTGPEGAHVQGQPLRSYRDVGQGDYFNDSNNDLFGGPSRY